MWERTGFCTFLAWFPKEVRLEQSHALSVCLSVQLSARLPQPCWIPPAHSSRIGWRTRIKTRNFCTFPWKAVAEWWPGPRALPTAQGGGNSSAAQSQQPVQFTPVPPVGLQARQFPLSTRCLCRKRCGGKRNAPFAPKSPLEKLERPQCPSQKAAPQGRPFGVSLFPGQSLFPSRRILPGARGRTLPGLGHQISIPHPDPHPRAAPVSRDSAGLSPLCLFHRENNEECPSSSQPHGVSSSQRGKHPGIRQIHVPVGSSLPLSPAQNTHFPTCTALGVVW